MQRWDAYCKAWEEIKMVSGLGRDPFRKQICQWNGENGGQTVASAKTLWKQEAVENMKVKRDKMNLKMYHFVLVCRARLNLH